MSLRGSHIAKQRILAHLQTHLPGYCAGVEASEGLLAGTVPFPKLYVQGPERNPEMIPGAGPGTFPAIFIGGGDIEEIVMNHGGGTKAVFEVRYDLQVTFWVQTDMSQDYNGIELQRDRLDVALRSCLMAKPNVENGIIRIELDSFTGEAHPSFESAAGFPQSAGRVQFTARQLEDLVEPLLVEPDDLDVVVTVTPL